jgi:hypothetical protein
MPVERLPPMPVERLLSMLFERLLSTLFERLLPTPGFVLSFFCLYHYARAITIVVGATKVFKL